VFIEDGAPDLPYAPFPVPDDALDTYGVGQIAPASSACRRCRARDAARTS
jgi:hypothetical protein